jgi:adenylyltransferase/sulfurtransferase
VGALGSTISQQLARAGIGRLRLIDGDSVEWSNLHRQVLYTEEDARHARPKADAASRALAAANSTVSLEAQTQRLTEANAQTLLGDAHVVLDGTDNLLSRYVINEACLALNIPWIYGGVEGTSGMVLPILPGQGPCLRCLFRDDPPEPGPSAAETTGVLAMAPATVGAIQAALAVRLLVRDEPPSPALLCLDVWEGQFQSVPVKRDPKCVSCATNR